MYRSLIALITQAPDNTVKKQYDLIENDPKFVKLFLFKLRAFTIDLIREGVNIDTMSNQDLQIFLASKISSWMSEYISSIS